MNEDDVIRIASTCLRQKIEAISKVGGGANSRVYRIVCPFGQYVVKFYFQHPLDSRDRLGTEYKSFSFLWESGLQMVPKPVAFSREHYCAFYDFIEGAPPGGDVAKKDVEAAADFLETLRDLSANSQSMALAPASEAFFSVNGIVSNIQARLDRIDHKVSGDEYDLLQYYLNQEFIPLFKGVSAWARDHARGNGISCDAHLPREFRTLSPSDFGFHNSLRIDERKIVFLDFEYFGWDDPAKMVSDFLWHPAMRLSEDLKVYFVQRMKMAFREDPCFNARLKSVFPLFGLKWCLIFLNEFIPTESDRRDFAAVQVKNRTSVRLEQLIKAQRLSKKIKVMYKDFPY